MSDYSKTTNFTAKDSLASGDPNKVIKGSEHDAEYDNIATAVATKANKSVPATTNNLAMLDPNGDLADSLVETDGAGNITANVTGDVTGDVTGNCTGTAGGLSGTALGGDVTNSGNTVTLAADVVGDNELISPASGATKIREILSSSIEIVGTTSYASLGDWTRGDSTGTRHVTVLVSGTVRVNLSHRTGGIGTSYARVCLNGVQQVEWSTTSGTAVSRTQDLSVSVGDIITIQTYYSGGGATYMGNAYISSDTANMAVV